MRPWLVWMLFAVCLAVVLAAMGWAGATVLRLDQAQALAQQQAELEENVRLALWRMDSALAPIVARESTWPYFAYTPFYPAQRAYTNMLLPVEQGEVLMPSPLLSRPSPHVLIHFQIGPDATFGSPQVPVGKVRELAEKGYITAEAIDAAARRLEALRQACPPAVLTAGLQAPDAPDGAQATVLLAETPGRQVQPAAEAQSDYGQRRERQEQQFAVQQQAVPQVQRTKGGKEFSSRALNVVDNSANFAQQSEVLLQQAAPGVREGITRPIWLDGRLLLARRVSVNRSEYVQGCWLDWPAIERLLLESVRDLLPDARLAPISGTAPVENGERALAALPVRLIPGGLPSPAMRTASPLRLSLAAAWACLLVAAAAVAALLAGALSLSERRGAFVSAVTHEMRTPLTTFRMYTEMLVKGMVPEDRRTRYLDTLRVEANRLAHLVENVLAYARLERGKPASRVEPVPAGSIVERVRGRLADRAEQAGMTMVVELRGRSPEEDHRPDVGATQEERQRDTGATRDPAWADADAQAELLVVADPMAVEQILFNLVDNACKYAAEASDRTIHLRVQAWGRAVHFEVADRGPGISREQERRLFRPFSKSAQQAAHSAPGVGLGLALSRRLARQMSGDLRYSPNDGHGACFVLSLPRA